MSKMVNMLIIPPFETRMDVISTKWISLSLDV